MTQRKGRRSSSEKLWIPQLCIFDTETTGLDFLKDEIVSAYVGIYDTRKRTITDGREYFIKPTIDIEEAAQKVNRLDPIWLMANGEEPKVALDDIAERLDAAMMNGIPICAMNAPFDFTMLNQNLERAGLDPFDDFYPVFDPLVIDRWKDPYRKGKRKLMALADNYSVEYDETQLHDAQEDALITGAVSSEIIKRMRQGDMTIQGLHNRQVKEAKKQGESLQAHFDRIGKEATINTEWPLMKGLASQ